MSAPCQYLPVEIALPITHGVACLVDTTWSETRMNTTINVALLGDS